MVGGPAPFSEIGRRARGYFSVASLSYFVLINRVEVTFLASRVKLVRVLCGQIIDFALFVIVERLRVPI